MAQREKFDRPSAKESRQSGSSARIDDDLNRLAMLRLVETTHDPADRLSRDRLIDLAYTIYETRRKRSQYFQASLLGEPVWDMLLALFCLPTARWKKMTITGLTEAAGLPLTTGLRWSNVMAQKGLIERRPDPLDARRIFVALSEKGERLMCDYLSSIYHRMRDPHGGGRS